MPREVYAPGSKKLAHNSDDLLMRWLERRGGELRPVSDLAPPFPGTANIEQDLFTDNPINITQARDQRFLAIKGLGLVESLLGGMGKNKVYGVRERLKERKNELLVYIRVANNFIREWSSLSSLEAIKQLIADNDTELVEAAKLLLEDSMRGRNGERPQQAYFERLNQARERIQDTLMARKLSSRG